MKKRIILRFLLILIFTSILLVLVGLFSSAYSSEYSPRMFVQSSYCIGIGSVCSTWNSDEPSCTLGGCSWQDSCSGLVSCDGFWDEISCSDYGCSWNSDCAEYEQICLEYEQVCIEWNEFEECISWGDGDCISWGDGECISWNEYCNGEGSACSTWNGDEPSCTLGGCSWQDSCSGSVSCSLLGDESSCVDYGCSWIEGSDCGGDVACSCGNILVESRTLNASDNLTNCEATGLHIDTEGIILDCNNLEISGQNTEYGIEVHADNVKIENCEIYSFNNGIYISDSDSANISNNNIHDNALDGIYVYSSGMDPNHFISGNYIILNCIFGSGSCAGIKLENLDNCNIQNNNISDNYYHGILLITSNNNYILSNDIYNNGWAGIIATSPIDSALGGHNTIDGNILVNNYKLGIATKTQNNIITNNIISADGGGEYLYGIDLRKTGSLYPENNFLSGNEVSGYQYGLDVWTGIENFTVDGDNYHDNDYGIYLSGVGVDENTMPSIRNSNVHDNLDGIKMIASIAYIENTSFTDNINILSGLDVDRDSDAYLRDSDFTGNVNYGIYAEGSVYWTLTEDVYCTDNNIEIADGFIIPMGGKIIAENCEITVNGEEFNLSGNQTGAYKETIDETTTSEFGNASYGVSGEIHTDSATYSGDLIVNFYEQNPGGSGFFLSEFGVWIDAALSPEPADLSWWILKIFYTDEELAASGLNEANLVIQFYNASDDTWTTEPNQGVNETGNYVWANLTHFSVFGIFGSAVTQPSGGNGGKAWTPKETIPAEESTVPSEQPEVSETPEEPAAEGKEKKAVKPGLLLWTLLLTPILVVFIILIVLAIKFRKKKALKSAMLIKREFY